MNKPTNGGGPRPKRRLHPAVRFRMRQALEASFDEDFVGLAPGTPEFRIAEKILLAFPYVRKNDNTPQGTTITTLAVNKAMSQMKGEDLKQMERVRDGIRVARRVLKRAYDTIQSQQKTEKSPAPA